jgi:deoxyribonuclease-4
MSLKKHTLLYGAHMSIAGGFEKAIERGESINCTAIQIFTKSNRQWDAKPLTQEAIDAFIESKKNSSIKSIIAHATYLINVGAFSYEIEKKSVHALEAELIRCEQLQIPYLVLHPGSATESSREDCIKKIAKNINAIFAKETSSTTILLELMAGQGTTIGSTVAELRQIYDLVDNKRRIGFCVDTCHAFVAGYNIATPEGYENLWKEFDKELGLHKVKAIHINDSKKECGSHVDRHEDIGKGKIGLEGFRLLMNDERFFDVPKVLETPKNEDLVEDARNMKILKSLLNKTTQRLLGE